MFTFSVTGMNTKTTNHIGAESIEIKYIKPDRIPVTGLPFEVQTDCMLILLNRPILKGDRNGKL